jgi:hypothetical protein
MHVRGVQKKRSRRLSLNGWIVIGVVFCIYWFFVSSLQSKNHEEPDANRLQPHFDNRVYHSQVHKYLPQILSSGFDCFG